MADFIWTKHVLARMSDRKISQNSVRQVLNSPDRKTNTTDGAMEYIKKIGNQTTTAIVKRNEKGEDIVLSVWIDPPNPGTQDEKKRSRYNQMRKASSFKKFWLTLLNQLGV